MQFVNPAFLGLELCAYLVLEVLVGRWRFVAIPFNQVVAVIWGAYDGVVVGVHIVVAALGSIHLAVCLAGPCANFLR